MAEVVASLLADLLSFCSARASDLVASTLADTASLAAALERGAATNDIALLLKQFHDDVVASKPAVQPAVVAIQPHVTAAKNAVAKAAADVGASPFTLASAAQAAIDLATVATELDAAIAIVAHTLGNMDDPTVANRKPLVETAINAIKEPWIAPLRGLAGGVGKDFDALATQVLGLPAATGTLDTAFARNAAAREIAFTFAAGGERAPVPAF
ncbi:MAG: hypothetical protein ABI442_16975, partial [Gemmatimonadaceae bacterium]